MNKRVVLLILIVALAGIVLAMTARQDGSDWKATMWANPPTKESCADCPALSPKDPNWQKDLGGRIQRMRDADAWWRALPSNPWTLDKEQDGGMHKLPVRPRGHLIPRYYGGAEQNSL
jgi:hypothetical protein